MYKKSALILTDNSKILPEIKEAEAVDIKETPTKPVGQLLQGKKIVFRIYLGIKY